MDYSEHRLSYCEFLISSQINYTQTYFGERSEKYSHDSINRFLRLDKLTPRLLWKNVCEDIVESKNGYLIFDDTVLDKRYSKKASLVRRQWSGNQKKVLNGIGVVTCVYVNPELERFWIVDYRIFDPQGDSQTKLEHMVEMLDAVKQRLFYKTVLMDTWYATMKIIKYIESLGKVYYCPIKNNRNVNDDATKTKHQRVDSLDWSEEEDKEGKFIHMKKMPKGHQVKLFRLVFSPEHTEFVITNDLSQIDADVVKATSGIRWNIEQFHREAKQVTGIESCQCRLSRALRNHIACSFLVWNHLNRLASFINTTIYQLKFGLLDNYMRQQLKHPSIPMRLC